MCTLIAERRPAGWRVTMNRDERRARGKGIAPFVWPRTAIIAPKDPDAGGTWIGANGHGRWAALLNGYVESSISAHEAKSRGQIIPAMLGAQPPEAAIFDLDLPRTRSFRLWVGEHSTLKEWFWDEQNLFHTLLEPDQFHFASSSSWRQDEVVSHRRSAFDDWRDGKVEQDCQNRPSVLTAILPNGPAWSCLMAREEAATQSITQLSISPENIGMSYWDKADLWAPAHQSQLAS